jgi:uncharacterized membrane protein YdcZ (DUF606 family)
MFNFFVGSIVMGSILFVSKFSQSGKRADVGGGGPFSPGSVSSPSSSPKPKVKVPFWAYLGGVIGAVYVTLTIFAAVRSSLFAADRM